MQKRLNFLYLEDNPYDAELVETTIIGENISCSLTRVETKEEFTNLLKTETYDLVLSDYALPNFSGIDALHIAQEHDSTLPFILISGTIGEIQAIEALKSGATDYILKDHLARLGPAIKRALAEADEHRKLKQTLEDLKTREAELAEAQRIAHIGNWSLELEGNTLQFSDEMYSIFCLERSNLDLTGESFYSRIYPEDIETVKKHFGGSITLGIPLNFECRITHPDNSIRYIHVLAKITTNSENKPIRLFGTAQDISDRKEAELKIQQQATLLDKAQDAISVNTLENNVVFWNKGAEKIYGWTKDEIIGKSAHALLFNKENMAEYVTPLKMVIEQGEWYGELHQITKSGKEIITQSHWTLIRDEQHIPKSIFVISTDISEKKQLESQFLRAQRMESIGTLASGIAHDLNNILSPIILASEILNKRLPASDAATLVDRIHKNAQRGADVVKQILSFARGVEGKPISIQVKHLIDDIVKIMKETFPKSIFIETSVPKDLWTISGDPTQLHQVFLNLCVNARDAMPDGGKFTITAENISFDESYARMNVGVKKGEYVVLTFKDSGYGIPQNIIDKIFDPFFTTKEVGKGTGLGLFTVHSIVNNHGGYINVHSSVGVGTTFTIGIPATSVESSSLETVPLPLHPRGHDELILVVDDELGIREITKEILVSNGYRVLTASDGTEAVMLFAQNHASVKAILTDIRMPYMDGIAAIRAIRKINPNVKIIASSGSGDSSLADQHHINDFLVKPYTAAKLLQTIENILYDAPMTQEHFVTVQEQES